MRQQDKFVGFLYSEFFSKYFIISIFTIEKKKGKEKSTTK